MSLSSSSVFNQSIPSEAIDYVINHPNYSRYLEYLKTWKEELNEDSSDRAEKICHMFNLGMVGHGDRRVCCYYEDYVIKLPLESCHYDSNENEVSLFNYLKDKHPNYLKYICPIEEFREGLIVTPYCEDFDNIYSDDDILDLCDDYRKRFLDIGVEFTDLDGPQQLKVLGGDIVILDYEDYEFINI